jgi:hypothetical protein
MGATNLEDCQCGIKALFLVLRHMTEARFVKRSPGGPNWKPTALHGYRINPVKPP